MPLHFSTNVTVPFEVLVGDDDVVVNAMGRGAFVLVHAGLDVAWRSIGSAMHRSDEPSFLPARFSGDSPLPSDGIY